MNTVKDKMKGLEKYISFIVLAAGLLLIFGYLSAQTPCSQVKQYSIGVFDERFGISRDDFLAVVASAENLWEQAAGRELFEYKPDAGFKINLIFDERQQRMLEAKMSKKDISSKELSYAELNDIYNGLIGEYRRRLDSYDVSIQEYKSDLAAYNEDVEMWNSREHIPPAMIGILKTRAEELNNRGGELDAQRREINHLAQEINSVSLRINNLVRVLSADISQYNEKFGGVEEFDQGSYDGDSIDIYQFDNKGNLIVLIAHEFGHALGLGHLGNSEAIMNKFIGKQDVSHPHLTPDDVKALQSECKL